MNSNLCVTNVFILRQRYIQLCHGVVQSEHASVMSLMIGNHVQQRQLI